MDNASRENRKSFRFPVSGWVDVLAGAERHAFGSLIDFSRDGAGIRCLTPLDMGRKYAFHIRGMGAWDGVVVRRFDGRSYGVRFENSEDEKREIDRILMDMLEGKADATAIFRPTRPRIRAF